MPTSEQIATAFGLGEPISELTHLRRGDADAWRLDTSTGRYFVKGYFHSDHRQLAATMAFEQLALDAGVDMPTPIVPPGIIRIEGRLFRAHHWVEHRPYDEDLSTWLGRTMLQVHRLQPLGVGLPQWWRDAIHSPATWEGWLTNAREREASWMGLFRDCLPHLLAATERIANLCNIAPDVVTTHGDFKPHNIVTSPTGPVLVDWDTVRTDSAALEAGRSAYIFGAGEPEQIKRILTAYVAAGGELGWAGQDLFLSVTRNIIQVLAEHIRVALGEATDAPWMGDRTTIETAIGRTLRDLPGTLDKLRRTTQTIDSV